MEPMHRKEWMEGSGSRGTRRSAPNGGMQHISQHMFKILEMVMLKVPSFFSFFDKHFDKAMKPN